MRTSVNPLSPELRLQRAVVIGLIARAISRPTERRSLARMYEENETEQASGRAFRRSLYGVWNLPNGYHFQRVTPGVIPPRDRCYDEGHSVQG